METLLEQPLPFPESSFKLLFPPLMSVDRLAGHASESGRGDTARHHFEEVVPLATCRLAIKRQQ